MFLAVRLLLHALAPKTYGPAGGYDIYTAMVRRGAVHVRVHRRRHARLHRRIGDLSEGMFRHLVVTGRSRLALYLARIPAGLAIIGSLVAVGFAIVCAVCVFAAPTHLDFNGVRRARPACRVPDWRTGPPTTPTKSSATSTSGRTVLATGTGGDQRPLRPRPQGDPRRPRGPVSPPSHQAERR